MKIVFYKILTLSIFLLIPTISFAQKYTISGYIKDVESKETLIGANAYDTISNNGTATNAYGFYSLTLPKGDVSVKYAFVGYDIIGKQFALNKDTTINIELHRGKYNTLEEVSVTANRSDIGVRGSQMSAIEVPIAQIKAVPALLGEVDVIKALQLLPGVQGGTEGTSGFYVRGGGYDENLILLDEIPVYNGNHAMGFFSIFNADAVKNVVLYKGSFPARFGERLSSVIDIRTKDGDAQKYHGNISIGLIASKINIEGPIIKNKTSFSFSARRTYFDILLKPFMRDTELEASGGYYFYDINAKINHKFSDKHRLFISLYKGDDAIYFRTPESTHYSTDENGNPIRKSEKLKTDMFWGNTIASLRWNYLINNKLFMNLTMAYSRYRFKIKNSNTITSYRNNTTNEQRFSLRYNSGIMDGILKTDFEYSPNPNNNIRFGLNYTIHQFNPEVLTIDATELEDNIKLHNTPIVANEISLYAEDNISPYKWLKVNAGARFSVFSVQKRYYKSIQPRLSSRFLLNNNLSAKIGYSYMNQYVHLLANSTINMPTDLWVPSTSKVPPLNTHQIALGLFYNLNKIYDLSIESYYKTMNNVVEYKDGASFFGLSKGWEDKVNIGRGWAYGVEFLLQRNIGNLTGWIGYTWSKSMRLFDRHGQEINFGKVFPAKFDRRHDFKITVAYKISKNIDLSGSWLYATGNTATLSFQSYQPLNNEPTPRYRQHKLDYIESRNNYRLPSYHRLDLGVNFNKPTKRGMHTWNISIYNLYNNINPFIVYHSSENGENVLKMLSIFPILPSVSYSFKF